MGGASSPAALLRNRKHPPLYVTLGKKPTFLRRGLTPVMATPPAHARWNGRRAVDQDHWRDSAIGYRTPTEARVGMEEAIMLARRFGSFESSSTWNRPNCRTSRGLRNCRMKLSSR